MREARMSNYNTNTCNRHLPLIFGEVSQLICVLFDSHHVPLVIRFHPVTHANRFDILKSFFVCKFSMFVDKHLIESSFAVTAVE